MDMTQKQKWLISALLLLAAMKFAVLPWMQWQEEKAANVSLLSAQLSKGWALLEHQAALQQRLQKLQESEQQLLSQVVYRDDSSTAFQLRLQKQLDELMAKHNLSVRNSNWLSPVQRGTMQEHRLEMGLSGELKQLLAFMADVEQVTPKLTILEASSQISNMRPNAKKLGDFNGRILIGAWLSVEG